MKKPFIYLLTAGLAVSMIANTGPAYAVGSANSNASVSFTAPTDTVAPVDPRDPSLPNDTLEGEEITGQVGPLSLDVVTNINFGDQNISSGEMDYESLSTSPYAQITDRRGSGEGWLVTAQVSNFSGTQGEGESLIELGNTLPSSTITFLNGEADSTSSTAGPEVNQTIALVTGGEPVNVANAKPGDVVGEGTTAEGLGTWVVRWLTSNTQNENVILTVPEASATEGNHSAVITWNLTDGPVEGSIDTTPTAPIPEA